LANDEILLLDGREWYVRVYGLNRC